MEEIVNAKITDTKLGYEDHCIFTCMLALEGSAWGCGFGGYALDEYNKSEKRRIATQQGFQAIIELMEALEVRNWEDLKGQYVRVVSQGLGGKITKIGHLIKDKWFSFEEFFEKHKGD